MFERDGPMWTFLQRIGSGQLAYLSQQVVALWLLNDSFRCRRGDVDTAQVSTMHTLQS